MPSNQFPCYEDLDLHSYPRIHGYHTLGLLKTVCTDVVWVTPDQWHNYEDCSWLHEIIQEALLNKKTVALVPWDEGLLNYPETNLSDVVNQYQDHPVWLVTQLDSTNQMIYTNQFKIASKIIELPWFLLNDALTYYSVATREPVTHDVRDGRNYLCMLGRYEWHKFELALALHERGLDQDGLITVSDPAKYPIKNLEFCTPNDRPPSDGVSQDSLPGLRSGAHFEYQDRWVSGNVKNFLYIEKTYPDIPLILHPDTTCGIFQNTEKVLWPLLLGRLMLIFGRPGIMASIQKFYDVDFSEYADLEFDNYCSDWSESEHRHRLNMLLERNHSLIHNADQVFKKLQHKLESARWTIGKNLYKYFVGNVNKMITNTLEVA